MALGTLLPARLPACSEAQTVYISPSGNDTTGSGAIGAPWKTPNKAYAAIALSGGLILCRGGSYGSIGQQRWDRAGDTGDPVEIRAYPAETPVFNGVTSWRFTGSGLRVRGLSWNPASNSGDNNISWINGASDIELLEMLITNSTSGVQPSSNQGVLIGGNAQDIQIWDSDFVGNGAGQNQTHCIYASDCNGLVVANFVMRDGGAGYGLQIYPNCDDAIITCGTLDGWTNRAGIVLGGDPSNASQNVKIVGCIVSGSDGQKGININWEGPTGSGVISDTIGFDNAQGDFDTSEPGVTWTNNLTNTDPLYDNRAGNDFHISDTDSPAKGLVPASREGYVPVLDKDGLARGSADAGAYRIGSGGGGGDVIIPENVTEPTVSGSPVEGQTLTASVGTWSGTDPTFTYQWRRCNAAGASCGDIGGATSSTYLLVTADIGSTIRVRVTGTNSAGSDVADSHQTPVVIGGSTGGGSGAPVNVVAPSIGGTARVGETLSSSPGEWDGDTPMTFAYQWQRCDQNGNNCGDITGETDETLLLTVADVGSRHKIRVTASN